MGAGTCKRQYLRTSPPPSLYLKEFGHLPSPLPLKTVLSNVQFLLSHQCLCCIQLRILN